MIHACWNVGYEQTYIINYRKTCFFILPLTTYRFGLDKTDKKDLAESMNSKGVDGVNHSLC